MKNLRLIAVLALLSYSIVQAADGLWAIKGEVLSVIPGEGLLIICSENRAFGLPKPKEGDVVFLKGDFPNAADGDKFKEQAFAIGTYQYSAVSGAAKTVRAFSLERPKP